MLEISIEDDRMTFKHRLNTDSVYETFEYEVLHRNVCMQIRVCWSNIVSCVYCKCALFMCLLSSAISSAILCMRNEIRIQYSCLAIANALNITHLSSHIWPFILSSSTIVVYEETKWRMSAFYIQWCNSTFLHPIFLPLNVLINLFILLFLVFVQMENEFVL